MYSLPDADFSWGYPGRKITRLFFAIHPHCPAIDELLDAMQKWGGSDHLTTRHFKPPLEHAKLSRKTRFHDLRHTCATLLLTKNVNPKVVSEMLGHASIAITLDTPLDTYSHVLPNMQDSAAKAMEDALS